MGEMVHLRLGKEMKTEIKEVVKDSLFSNMTEFIRAAIRKAVEEYQKQKAIAGLRKLKGSAKPLTKKERIKAQKELTNMSDSEIFRKFGLN